MTKQNTVSEMVFIPLDREQAIEISRGNQLSSSLPAIQGNNLLARSFDLAPDSEEVDLAALQVASVWALLLGGARLVLTARVPSQEISEDSYESANGGVRLERLDPSWIEAFFCGQTPQLDEKSITDASAHTIDDLWDMPSVQQLLSDDPLLWHDITELAEWLATSSDGEH